MKTKKSYILVLFSAIIFFVGTFQASAIFFLESNEIISVFKDIAFYNDYYDAITYVKERGIMSGYADGTFKPKKTVNRAEFMKIIMETKYGDEFEGKNCFEDVHSEWFAPYICTAKNLKVVGGHDDGTFRPSEEIAFAAVSKILINAFGYETKGVATYEWYKPFVDILDEKKAIPSTVQSFLQPINRAEMAEIIYRLQEGIVNKDSNTYEKMSFYSGSIDYFYSHKDSKKSASYTFRYPKKWQLIDSKTEDAGIEHNPLIGFENAAFVSEIEEKGGRVCIDFGCISPGIVVSDIFYLYATFTPDDPESGYANPENYIEKLIVEPPSLKLISSERILLGKYEVTKVVIENMNEIREVQYLFYIDDYHPVFLMFSAVVGEPRISEDRVEINYPRFAELIMETFRFM